MMKAMAEEKKTDSVAEPVYVVSSTPVDGGDSAAGTNNTSDAKRRSIKKYVIFAVAGVLALAIILSAILVGMYFFTEAQKEILKYTLTTDKNGKQDVTNYPSSNVITYHVNNENYETWVVEDYNQDIKVFKIKTQTETNCYAVPFNRTTDVDVSQIKAPSNTNVKANSSTKLNFVVANTPIADTSFLSKQARDECKGISIYWLFPSCDSDKTTSQRSKRYWYCRYQYTYCCRYTWYGFCSLWCDYYLCGWY